MIPKNGIQLDNEMIQQIESAAADRGISPTDLIREAVSDYVAAHPGNGTKSSKPVGRWLLESAAEARSSVPIEAWAEVPNDLAQNFDQYLHDSLQSD